MLVTEKVPGPIVLSKRGWYQGVMGIVAARITEVHRLPTVMICVDEDGVGRGSCRSFGDFQLYHALEACSDLLINFGGHEMAAGITTAALDLERMGDRQPQPPAGWGWRRASS